MNWKVHSGFKLVHGKLTQKSDTQSSSEEGRFVFLNRMQLGRKISRQAVRRLVSLDSVITNNLQDLKHLKLDQYLKRKASKLDQFIILTVRINGYGQPMEVPFTTLLEQSFELGVKYVICFEETLSLPI